MGLAFHLLQELLHRPRIACYQGGREQGWGCAGLADGCSVCPQIMSVLLFIEHSVEVAHGKASCKAWQTGYLRLGRSGGRGRGPRRGPGCR